MLCAIEFQIRNSILVNKVSLSPFDSKRWIVENGVDTLAYGHKDIPGPFRLTISLKAGGDIIFQLKYKWSFHPSGKARYDLATIEISQIHLDASFSARADAGPRLCF